VPGIAAIARLAHPQLPERPEVFAEKVALFPAGCLVLADHGAVSGYALSHPWRLGDIPPLDALLGPVPAAADCLFVHDIALAPEVRGRGFGPAAMRRLEALARAQGLPAMAIVSVYGSHPLWQRLGFEIGGGVEIALQLRTYGAGARYMVKRLG